MIDNRESAKKGAKNIFGRHLRQVCDAKADADVDDKIFDWRNMIKGNWFSPQ